MNETTTDQNLIVAALYQFAEIPDYARLREPLLQACLSNGVFGTILLASEGINGTIAGSRQGIDAVVAHIHTDERLRQLQYKESHAARMPFHRMKVRLKREIVALGVPDINPARDAGQYVKPQDWNALISDPDVVVVDTRNDYEVAIGTFEGALNPKTKAFRELPRRIAEEDALKAKPRVAMFCTGGIRCEKSTAYMRSLGFTEVFHLEGGILKYLETIPEEESLWHGECFVFDGRVSVRHGLAQGSYDLCHGCRQPLSPEEAKDERYVPGCCCPKCHDTLTADQLKRFSERQKQIELARQRGEQHLDDVTANETDMPAPGLPVLYSFRRCPYAMRARMSIASAGIRCELREIVLRDKPAAMIAISPKATVPVLQLPDGAVIDESLDIMRWALAEHDPEDWLNPENSSLGEACALIEKTETQFKPHLDRYKYSERYPGASAADHRATASAFIELLEERLTRSPYLFGDRACIADMAIFPFVRQFANIDRDWFSATPYRHTQTWLAKLLDSELFNIAMKKYPVWQYGQEAVFFPE